MRSTISNATTEDRNATDQATDQATTQAEEGYKVQEQPTEDNGDGEMGQGAAVAGSAAIEEEPGDQTAARSKNRPLDSDSLETPRDWSTIQDRCSKSATANGAPATAGVPPYSVSNKKPSERAPRRSRTAKTALTTATEKDTKCRQTVSTVWNVAPLYCSKACRDRIFAVYPGLQRYERRRRFFVYLLLSRMVKSRDGETRGILISRECLAHIEGKTKELRGHRYCGLETIDEYREHTNHLFEFEDYYYPKGFARIVTALNLDERVIQALADDFAKPVGQLVDFVTGRRFDRQRSADECKALLQAASERVSPYAESNNLLRYLNESGTYMEDDGEQTWCAGNSRRRCFADALKQHGAEAVQAVLGLTNPVRRVHSLCILLSMRTHPIQYYGASLKGNTRRIFPTHLSYAMLPREIRMILERGWYDFDLTNAQLAICARLWDIPEIKDFLRKGGKIWVELLTHLGWPVDDLHKPPVKTALYAIIFGVSRKNLATRVAEEHVGHVALQEMGADEFAKRLRKHRFINALERARNRMRKDILRARGAFDCYGEFIGLPVEVTARGRPRYNPRSVLAQVAQAMEFWIVASVLEMARRTRAFTIVHWAHDGFTVKIRDRNDAAKRIARIEQCVNEQAQNANVITALVTKSSPDIISSEQAEDGDQDWFLDDDFL